jgi:CO dehydrogenase/acetyl-CoA synthase delta subunit
VHDLYPEKYPQTLMTGWQELVDHPGPVETALAAKNLGADLIALRVESIRETDKNAAEIVELAKEIMNSTALPLCILGINNRELDRKYLPQISQGLNGYNCLIRTGGRRNLQRHRSCPA